MSTDENRSMINAPNRVPQHQKYYQSAYASHQRLWKIVRDARRARLSSRVADLNMTQGPRANFMLVPYQILLWGTFGSMHNSPNASLRSPLT
jgi:hypothetical protein